MPYFLVHLIVTIRQVVADPLGRFVLSLLTLVGLTLFGTIMYMMIEGWNMGEALYMTIITIATVGFGEVQPLSPQGRQFTIVLILLGVGAATTAISSAVSLALGPLLWQSIAQRRNRAMVQNLHDHYIVCGYGRMGRQIVRDLRMREERFVLVDSSEDIEERLLAQGIPHILGDATRDETLLQAGIEKARGLVAALNSDSDNVMTVLTARELNPNLLIVARVVHVESESKLRRAGANRVINPYQIGGHRMALSLLRPAVHDFLNEIFHFGEGREIDIGQMKVDENSHLLGRSIAQSGLRKDYNVNILAIRQPQGQTVLTPDPDTILQAGTTLIVIGPPEAIYRVERQHPNSG